MAETWQDEYDNGNYRRTADLLSQIKDDIDVDGLLALGTIYLNGMHHFDSDAEYMRFHDTAPADQQRAFWQDNEESRLCGIGLLEQASQKGSWVASHNLATYYTSSVRGMSEEERREKANYYYDLADRQRLV